MKSVIAQFFYEKEVENFPERFVPGAGLFSKRFCPGGGGGGGRVCRTLEWKILWLRVSMERNGNRRSN